MIFFSKVSWCIHKILWRDLLRFYSTCLKSSQCSRWGFWYDKTTVHKNVPFDLETKCINCGKTIGCTLGNQPLEEFINGLSQMFCFSMLVYLGSIILKKNLSFISIATILIGYIMTHGITLQLFKMAWFVFWRLCYNSNKKQI